ncbi:hypothetical protein B0T16DRAFT_403004 [Cercophora newfieldiana]|uniref:HD domain-containing protein n=1 Tax=Cercophora newfieldiana TaxID=92897 RepID=A0AA40CTP8_9PEZI|nr:hypothetical protein B0T16DRAFT_403004 [Cercophora newfieldiana]
MMRTGMFLPWVVLASWLANVAQGIPVAGSHGPRLPLPRRTVAGVSVVDTPLVQAAQQYMRDHSNDGMYRHVMRTWLFGTLMVSNNATLAGLVDAEVQAVSLLLHDLGADRSPGSPLISPDRRFEVDGAIAARDFIRDHRDGRRWDKHRVQLVWDAIAFHTEQKYALYKEPDVAVVSTGVMMDFVGPNSGVTSIQYAAVVNEFPNDDLRDNVRDLFTWLCSTKPISTYDTFQQAFGERFVANYSAIGNRTIDLVFGPE